MFGVLQSAGSGEIIRFERRIERPVEKVWAALTVPERIADWFQATAEVEPRVGGRFHLAFRNGPHTMSGVITRFEPPHVLEYTWPESSALGDSRVLWTLHEEHWGCRLVLTHTLPHGGGVADFGSGWHWHLDALPDAVDGRATAWDEPAWRALKARYEVLFSSQPAA